MTTLFSEAIDPWSVVPIPCIPLWEPRDELHDLGRIYLGFPGWIGSVLILHTHDVSLLASYDLDYLARDLSDVRKQGQYVYPRVSEETNAGPTLHVFILGGLR